MDKRRGNFEPTYKKCTECGSNVRQFKNNKRSDDDKCSKCRWTINRKAYIKKYSSTDSFKEKAHKYYKKTYKPLSMSGRYYDFETHRELAINSGIENMPEWIEVHQMGLMPDGIYRRPDQYLKKTLPPSAIVSRNRRCTYNKVE
tara:strand:+ start:441 stop:872 length:432 start_codon:yes stop_codon:yes gene_type:complete